LCDLLKGWLSSDDIPVFKSSIPSEVRVRCVLLVPTHSGYVLAEVSVSPEISAHPARKIERQGSDDAPIPDGLLVTLTLLEPSSLPAPFAKSSSSSFSAAGSGDEGARLLDDLYRCLLKRVKDMYESAQSSLWWNGLQLLSTNPSSSSSSSSASSRLPTPVLLAEHGLLTLWPKMIDGFLPHWLSQCPSR